MQEAQIIEPELVGMLPFMVFMLNETIRTYMEHSLTLE